MDIQPTFAKRFEISDSICDFKRKPKLSAILHFFQDVATVHSGMLNCGFDAMRERGYFWVLSRVALEFSKPPAMQSDILVETFPEPPLPLQCHRCYTVSDRQGNRIINGYSMWCVLDISRNRLTPIKNIQLADPSRYLDKDFSLTLDKLPIDDPGELCYIRPVRVSDLDANIHMNNAKYADLLEDAFCFEELRDSDFKRIQINFLSQSREGDEIYVYKKPIGPSGDDVQGERSYRITGLLHNQTPCFSAAAVLKKNT